MTAPLTPQPSWPAAVILICGVAVAIAMPFGRRTDFVGWAAFLTIAAAAIGLWGLLIYGFCRAFAQWLRKDVDVEQD